MKTIIIALSALAAFAPLHAQEKVSQNGNRVIKPGSQKGKIAFIVTQDEVPFGVFRDLAVELAKDSLYNSVCEKAENGEPAALKAKSKADIAVIIRADDTTPSLLAAVDDGWAVVNVRKLAEGLKTPEAVKKFHEKRCRSQMLRAYVAVAGGFSSQYQGNILSIRKISDFDLCETFIPNDAAMAMERYLAARGVTPAIRKRYRSACQEGWAPAPTNDIQKAIWDEVHAIPTKPIKIEYNEKRDKGK